MLLAHCSPPRPLLLIVSLVSVSVSVLVLMGYSLVVQELCARAVQWFKSVQLMPGVGV
jgi:hypothetical protein